MGMKLTAFAAVAVACLSFSCQDKKTETAEKNTSTPASGSAASTSGSATGSASTPKNTANVDTAGLPSDLAELAELPPLTAEATPEEIDRRMNRWFDGLAAFLELISEHEDCDQMGDALGRFAVANKLLLKDFSTHNNDPKVNARVGELISQRGQQWLQKLAANLQKCATNPKVVGALMKLSAEQ